MIRTLRPSDVVALLLLHSAGGGNLAETRERIGRDGTGYATALGLLRCGLSSRRQRCIWVGAEGWKVWGIATARTRSGPRAWEVEHLYLSPRAQSSGAELLETISTYAGQRGAERVFLRTPLSSPLDEVAQRAGFFPVLREFLYIGHGPHHEAPAPASEGLREYRPEDAFALFRLYNAATPAKVRSAYGLTFDQWLDAQERRSSRTQEYVLEVPGCLHGWVRCIFQGGGQLEVLTHPQGHTQLPGLVAFALGQFRRPGRIACLVPEYQENLSTLLTQWGFDEAAQYLVMVKAVAARVEEPSLAPVQA